MRPCCCARPRLDWCCSCPCAVHARDQVDSVRARLSVVVGESAIRLVCLLWDLRVFGCPCALPRSVTMSADSCSRESGPQRVLCVISAVLISSAMVRYVPTCFNESKPLHLLILDRGTPHRR